MNVRKQVKELLGTELYNKYCIRQENNMLYIDDIVYEIINGYYGYGKLYNRLNDIFTTWAISKGATYYDFMTSSVIVLGDK